MLPEAFYHHLEQVLQLIGLALWPTGIVILWRWGVAHRMGLPLAAAAARHLRCIHAVPHFNRAGRGLGPRSGSWSRGRGSGVSWTPVQSWPRHRLH